MLNAPCNLLERLDWPRYAGGLFELQTGLRTMTDPAISCEWIFALDEQTTSAIVALVDCAASDNGTLGYAEPMSTDESQDLVAGLER